MVIGWDGALGLVVFELHGRDGQAWRGGRRQWESSSLGGTGFAILIILLTVLLVLGISVRIYFDDSMSLKSNIGAVPMMLVRSGRIPT